MFSAEKTPSSFANQSVCPASSNNVTNYLIHFLLLVLHTTIFLNYIRYISNATLKVHQAIRGTKSRDGLHKSDFVFKFSRGQFAGDLLTQGGFIETVNKS